MANKREEEAKRVRKRIAKSVQHLCYGIEIIQKKYKFKYLYCTRMHCFMTVTVTNEKIENFNESVCKMRYFDAYQLFVL